MKKRIDYLSEEQRKFIANRVHDLFEELKDKRPDLTQKEIAQTIGISRSMLNRIFNPDGEETFITLANLIKIADYFNVNLDYLIKPGEIKSTDIKKREICKALKISEKAYDQIMEIKESKYVRDRKTLNFILENLEYLIEPLGHFLMPKELSGYLFKEDPDDQVMDLDSNDIELLFLEQVRQTLILCKELKENREKTGKVNGKE